MLNSRYAPVVALTVLAMVLILVLGYFLAIKPQWSEAAELRTTAEGVRSNTLIVEASSAQIDEFATALEQADDVEGVIALNAPPMPDVDAFRARLDRAINDSRLEVLTYAQEGTVEYTRWSLVNGTLVSAQMATLFQTGPTAVEGEEAAAWTPVVAAQAAPVEAGEPIYAVPFTVTVIGSPQETFDFLNRMRAEDQPIFEISTLTQEARNADGAPITGIAPPADGDVITTLTGSLFALDPDSAPESAEEGPMPQVQPPGESAFIDSPGAGPQPGA